VAISSPFGERNVGGQRDVNNEIKIVDGGVNNFETGVVRDRCWGCIVRNRATDAGKIRFARM